MKIEKLGTRITDLPGGVVIEADATGSVSFKGFVGGFTMAMDEARQIRDALNAVLEEDNPSLYRIGADWIRDVEGDMWWKLPNGTYVCEGNPPSPEDVSRYVERGLGSSREYIRNSYGIAQES